MKAVVNVMVVHDELLRCAEFQGYSRREMVWAKAEFVQRKLCNCKSKLWRFLVQLEVVGN